MKRGIRRLPLFPDERIMLTTSSRNPDLFVRLFREAWTENVPERDRRIIVAFWRSRAPTIVTRYLGVSATRLPLIQLVTGASGHGPHVGPSPVLKNHGCDALGYRLTFYEYLFPFGGFGERLDDEETITRSIKWNVLHELAHVYQYARWRVFERTYMEREATERGATWLNPHGKLDDRSVDALEVVALCEEDDESSTDERLAVFEWLRTLPMRRESEL